MADPVRAVRVACLFGPVGEVNEPVASVVPEQLIAAAVIGADSRRAVILRGIGPVQRAQLVPVGVVLINGLICVTRGSEWRNADLSNNGATAKYEQ